MIEGGLSVSMDSPPSIKGLINHYLYDKFIDLFIVLFINFIYTVYIRVQFLNGTDDF